MLTVIHRSSINGKPSCSAEYGKLSVSGAFVTCQECLQINRPRQEQAGQVYAVKCDDCKKIVSFTHILKESAEGTLCRACKQ